MYVREAVEFFFPYALSALILALIFGATMRAKFAVDGEAGTSGYVNSVSRSTTFFLMFAVFGVAIAYFLSLGIKEEQGNPGTWVNPLMGQFATPLIALLTAGVTYFAKREAPEGALPIVAAGVTCFLAEAVLCYKGFFLQLTGEL